MQKGIMQEIKDHLEEDVSSGELIAMGCRPATVYKAQRAWREAQLLERKPFDVLYDREEKEVFRPPASEEECVDVGERGEGAARPERLHDRGHDTLLHRHGQAGPREPTEDAVDRALAVLSEILRQLLRRIVVHR